MSRRLPVPTGIALVLRKTQLSDLDLVVRLPDHEADEALHARADQKSVDMRHVVGHQQRRAAERHVLLPHDANAEDGVGHHPEHEADQEIVHHGDDVDRDEQRDEAEDQDQAVRARSCSLSWNSHSAPEASSRADRVVEVVGGDDAALSRSRRRVAAGSAFERHDEEAARRLRAPPAPTDDSA